MNACEYCEYKTTQKDDLKTHLKDIYQIEYYSCDHCNFKSIQSIVLKYHTKTIHKDITCLKCIECQPKKKMKC